MPSDSDAPTVGNDIIGQKLSHHGPGLSNECEMALKYLLSGVASDSDALNIDNDIPDEYQVIMGQVPRMNLAWH